MKSGGVNIISYSHRSIAGKRSMGRRKQISDNTAKVMRREECGNIRSVSVSRLHSQAGKYSAKSEHGTIHGISEEKE